MDPTIEIILYICTVITSISAAATIIVKISKKAIKKVTEETIKTTMNECQEKLDKRIEELHAKLESFIQNQRQADERVRKSLLANTRDRINQAHDYYMKKGYIGAHSLFIIEELYVSYKELGGNSFIDRQMEDIRELEVKSAETINQ